MKHPAEDTINAIIALYIAQRHTPRPVRQLPFPGAGQSEDATGNRVDERIGEHGLNG